MMTAIWILLAVFILFQILDAATTFIILNQGGQEDNPIILWVAKYVGVRWALVFFKLVAITVIGAVVYFDGDAAPRLILGVLVALCAFYVWVICHNLLVVLFNKES